MERTSQVLLTFLLNACWQTALIAAVAAICSRILRSSRASNRYVLWVAALVISVGVSAVTCSRLGDGSLLKREPAASTFSQRSQTVANESPSDANTTFSDNTF